MLNKAFQNLVVLENVKSEMTNLKSFISKFPYTTSDFIRGHNRGKNYRNLLYKSV